MATVSQLADLLIEVLPDETPADIRQRARILREKGMLPQKGRGTSAAQITDEHAVRLFLAVLAGGPASHVADAVSRVEALTSAAEAWEGLDIADIPADLLGALSWVVRAIRAERPYPYAVLDVAVHGPLTHPLATVRVVPEGGSKEDVLSEQYGVRSYDLHPTKHRTIQTRSVEGSILTQIAALLAGHPNPSNPWCEEP